MSSFTLPAIGGDPAARSAVSRRRRTDRSETSHVHPTQPTSVPDAPAPAPRSTLPQLPRPPSSQRRAETAESGSRPSSASASRPFRHDAIAAKTPRISKWRDTVDRRVDAASPRPPLTARTPQREPVHHHLAPLIATQTRLVNEDHAADLQSSRSALTSAFLVGRSNIIGEEYQNFAPIAAAERAERKRVRLAARSVITREEQTARIALTSHAELEGSRMWSTVLQAVQSERSREQRQQLLEEAAASADDGARAQWQMLSRHEEANNAAIVIQILLRRPLCLRVLGNALFANEAAARAGVREERLASIRSLQWVEVIERCEVREQDTRTCVCVLSEQRHRHAIRVDAAVGGATVHEMRARAVVEVAQVSERLEVCEAGARDALEVEEVCGLPVAWRRIMAAPHRVEALLTLQRKARQLRRSGSMRVPRQQLPPRSQRVTAAALSRQIAALEASTEAASRPIPVASVDRSEAKAREAIEATCERVRARIAWLRAAEELAMAAQLLKHEAIERHRCETSEVDERALLRVEIAASQHRSSVYQIERQRRAFLVDAAGRGAVYGAAAVSVKDYIVANVDSARSDTATAASGVSSPEGTPPPVLVAATSMTPNGGTDIEGLRFFLALVEGQPVTRAASALSALTPDQWAAASSANAARYRAVTVARGIVASSGASPSRAATTASHRANSSSVGSPRPPHSLAASRTTAGGRSRADTSRGAVSTVAASATPAAAHERDSFKGGSATPPPSRATGDAADDDAPLSAFITVDPPPSASPATRTAPTREHHDSAEFDEVVGPAVFAQLELYRGGLLGVHTELVEAEDRADIEAQEAAWIDYAAVTWDTFLSATTAERCLGLHPPQSDEDATIQEAAVEEYRVDCRRSMALVVEWEGMSRQHVATDEARAHEQLFEAAHDDLSRVRGAIAADNDGGEGSPQQLKGGPVPRALWRLDRDETGARRQLSDTSLADHAALLRDAAHASSLLHVYDANSKDRLGLAASGDLPRVQAITAVATLQRWWLSIRDASALLKGPERALGIRIVSAQRNHVAAIGRAGLVHRKLARDRDFSSNANVPMLPDAGFPRRRAHALVQHVGWAQGQEASHRCTLQVIEGHTWSQVIAKPAAKARAGIAARDAATAANAEKRKNAKGSAAERLQSWWRRVLLAKRWFRRIRIRQLLTHLQRVFASRRASVIVPFAVFCQTALGGRSSTCAADGRYLDWDVLPLVRDFQRRFLPRRALAVLSLRPHHKALSCAVAEAAQRGCGTVPAYNAPLEEREVAAAIAHAGCTNVMNGEAKQRTTVRQLESAAFESIVRFFNEALPKPPDAGIQSTSTPLSPQACVVFAEEAGRLALHRIVESTFTMPMLQVYEALERHRVALVEAQQREELTNVMARGKVEAQAFSDHFIAVMHTVTDDIVAEKAATTRAIEASVLRCEAVCRDRVTFERLRAELLTDCLTQPRMRLRLVGRSEESGRDALQQWEWLRRVEIEEAATAAGLGAAPVDATAGADE